MSKAEMIRRLNTIPAHVALEAAQIVREEHCSGLVLSRNYGLLLTAKQANAVVEYVERSASN